MFHWVYEQSSFICIGSLISSVHGLCCLCIIWSKSRAVWTNSCVSWLAQVRKQKISLLTLHFIETEKMKFNQHISFAQSWLWPVGPLLSNDCAKLLDIGSNRNTLSHTSIQSIVLTRVKILTPSMPIAHSLETLNIMLCDKTAHFRVAFYCDQPKAHLCTNHTV